MILMGFSGALIIVEIIIRVSVPVDYNNVIFDQESGLPIRPPNSSFQSVQNCINNKVIINELGFHGPALKRASTTDKEIFKIVVIGGSFVEALQVPLEDMFTEKLEKKLNAEQNSILYEVIPLAYSGNGTYLDALYFNRFAKPMHPDLVINLLTDYELRKNLPNTKYPPSFNDDSTMILALPEREERPLVTKIKNILRESKLFMTLFQKSLLVVDYVSALKNSPTFFLPNMAQADKTENDALVQATVAEQESLWAIEDRIFNAYNKLVQENSSNFLIISWQNPETLDTDKTSLSSHLNEIATKEKISYFDMKDIVYRKEQQNSKSATWSCDGHWSPEGHEYVAEALFDYLSENKNLIEGKL